VVASVSGDPALIAQLAAHREWLAAEILAVELAFGSEADLGPSAVVEEAALPEGRLRLAVRRA